MAVYVFGYKRVPSASFLLNIDTSSSYASEFASVFNVQTQVTFLSLYGQLWRILMNHIICWGAIQSMY